jgi:hypothetical protein
MESLGMLGGGAGYYGNDAQASMQKAVQMPTLQQRLDLAVKQAEERLAAVKEARDILNRNPDLEKLLNIMQKSHF